MGSYCVLRVRTAASADAFWSALRELDDVPDAVRVLLTGRVRVELTRAEADAALAWLADVDGWDRAEPKPLFVYDPRG
jgi:hypothetical protein